MTDAEVEQSMVSALAILSAAEPRPMKFYWHADSERVWVDRGDGRILAVPDDGREYHIEQRTAS